MATLTTEQSDNLKDIVLHYLQGEAINVAHVRLQAECAELQQDCTSLYQSIHIEGEDEDVFIRAILGSLNIKKSRHPKLQGPYEKLLDNSDNLHELLTHLYHDGHHHVGYLLRLIENTKPKPDLTPIFVFGAISSVGLGGLLFAFKVQMITLGHWFIHTFPSVVNWLGKTFSLLRNIPFLGIIFYGLGLLWSWYHTFTNGTTTTMERLNRLFFKTLTAGLTISAYALSYLAEGAMTISAAVLFVLSASTDVFQSLFDWFRSRRALQTLPPPADSANWEIVAEYRRAKNLHQHTLKTVWIKLGAAILTTIAVGVWNFFPPTFAVAVGCIAFIWLIGLAKWSILRNFEEESANNLQRKLRNIDASLKPELSPTKKKTLVRLSQKQKSLLAKEKELTAREQELYEHEKCLALHSQTVIDTLGAMTQGLTSPARALALLQKDENTLTLTTEPTTTRSHLSDPMTEGLLLVNSNGGQDPFDLEVYGPTC